MRIAIITGGLTGERAVSLKSAHNVKKIIDFADTQTFVFPEELPDFIKASKDFDLVIPMIHGLGGEDGTLQGLLKNLNLPFIFSDITAHAIAIDKVYTKEIARTLGITSPAEIKGFPVFAKPRKGGSSVSSKFCVSSEELDALIKADPDTEFILEEPIKGREFTVGVIDYEGQITVLPVIEIVPKGEFFDFDGKYDPKKLANEICPANIDKTLESELQRQAKLVHTHLGVKDLSRSDFIVSDNGQIYFLEINTIPGMTETSLVPKMIATARLSLGKVFKYWCGRGGGSA